MAFNVIWADGAEHYSVTANSDISDIITDGLWDSASNVRLSNDPRTGSYAFYVTGALGYLRRTLSGDRSRVGVLFSFNCDNLPGTLNTQFAVAQFRNASNHAIATVQLTPTGRVRLLDYAGNQLAISTREVAAGYHNFFEFRLISGTSVSVRVNDKSAFTVTASGTLQSLGENGVTLGDYDAVSVHFGQISGSQTAQFGGKTIWDDIAAYTFESGDDSTYLGLYGAYYLKPNADTATAVWQKSTGTVGYELINSVAPDGDTAFLFSENTGEQSNFTVEPLPSNVTDVLAVAPIAYVRKTDSGPGSIQLGVNSNGTEELNGDDLPILTDYGFFQTPFQTDPDTSSAWDPTAMPEIIIKRTV